ncbi:MAG: trehalase family glycosidase [Pseudomonadota bacterium]
MEDLNEKARQILRNNDRGGYTVPTDGLYPYQWNWDSVFVALGFATFDRERAWQELDTLFEAQWPDGMVPHIVFRVDEPTYYPGPSVWKANNGPIPSSGITQPPVAAIVIEELGREDPARATGFVEALDRWHQWFHDARDPDELGVIAVTHPWESGRDNLPDWDRPGDAIDVSNVGEYTRRDTSLINTEMRPKKADYDRYLALVQFGSACGWDQRKIAAECPFFVADPGITSILLRAEKSIHAMLQRAGQPADHVAERIARLEAGMERLWNDDANAYVTLDLRSGQQADGVTSASFLPLFAGVTAHKDSLTNTLAAIAKHVTHLVPSFDPRSPHFDHVRYWRGPAWAMVNYMIAQGFAESGEEAWASRIRSDTAKLMRTGGFAEYFSPIDGQGCGGGTFSWTAAIWLAWGLQELGEE